MPLRDEYAAPIREFTNLLVQDGVAKDLNNPDIVKAIHKIRQIESQHGDAENDQEGILGKLAGKEVAQGLVMGHFQSFNASGIDTRPESVAARREALMQYLAYRDFAKSVEKKEPPIVEGASYAVEGSDGWLDKYREIIKSQHPHIEQDTVGSAILEQSIPALDLQPMLEGLLIAQEDAQEVMEAMGIAGPVARNATPIQSPAHLKAEFAASSSPKTGTGTDRKRRTLPATPSGQGGSTSVPTPRRRGGSVLGTPAAASGHEPDLRKRALFNTRMATAGRGFATPVTLTDEPSNTPAAYALRRAQSRITDGALPLRFQGLPNEPDVPKVPKRTRVTTVEGLENKIAAGDQRAMDFLQSIAGLGGESTADGVYEVPVSATGGDLLQRRQDACLTQLKKYTNIDLKDYHDAWSEARLSCRLIIVTIKGALSQSKDSFTANRNALALGIEGLYGKCSETSKGFFEAAVADLNSFTEHGQLMAWTLQEGCSIHQLVDQRFPVTMRARAATPGLRKAEGVVSLEGETPYTQPRALNQEALQGFKEVVTGVLGGIDELVAEVQGSENSAAPKKKKSATKNVVNGAVVALMNSKGYLISADHEFSDLSEYNLLIQIANSLLNSEQERGQFEELLNELMSSDRVFTLSNGQEKQSKEALQKKAELVIKTILHKTIPNKKAKGDSPVPIEVVAPDTLNPVVVALALGFNLEDIQGPEKQKSRGFFRGKKKTKEAASSVVNEPGEADAKSASDKSGMPLEIIYNQLALFEHAVTSSQDLDEDRQSQSQQAVKKKRSRVKKKGAANKALPTPPKMKISSSYDIGADENDDVYIKGGGFATFTKVTSVIDDAGNKYKKAPDGAVNLIHRGEEIKLEGSWQDFVGDVTFEKGYKFVVDGQEAAVELPERSVRDLISLGGQSISNMPGYKVLKFLRGFSVHDHQDASAEERFSVLSGHTEDAKQSAIRSASPVPFEGRLDISPKQDAFLQLVAQAAQQKRGGPKERSGQYAHLGGDRKTSPSLNPQASDNIYGIGGGLRYNEGIPIAAEISSSSEPMMSSPAASSPVVSRASGDSAVDAAETVGTQHLTEEALSQLEAPANGTPPPKPPRSPKSKRTSPSTSPASVGGNRPREVTALDGDRGGAANPNGSNASWL